MSALAYAAVGLPLAGTCGYALQRARGRLPTVAVAWTLAGATIAGAALAAHGAPFMPRMLLLVASTLVGMKCVVAAHATDRLAASAWAWFCVWPGMDPRSLAQRGAARPAARLFRAGALGLLSGLACVAVAVRAPLPRLASLVLVFAGSSLAVHFGLFTWATALLRRLGFAAERLFRAPWRATNLAEFWGRRWNLGFAELTALVVHRPLRRRLGRGPATWAAFLFSGVLHELAITLPARGGYGQPTLYFAVQALAFRVEQDHALRGRVWTWTCLLLPVPLAFPAAFRDQVLAWFAQSLGA
ncbi:MAG: MBOAT family protein [Planctomycetota bacterium]